MAVGRLDTFSIEQQVGKNSVIEKASTKIDSSQDKIKAKSASGAQTMGAKGIHVFSDSRYGNGDNVVQKSADNVSGFISGQLNGTGTKVNISA